MVRTGIPPFTGTNPMMHILGFSIPYAQVVWFLIAFILGGIARGKIG